MSDSELRHHVNHQLAVRHFAVWHDHSTVCGCGFILVTCKEVYKNLVHYTNDEYKNLTGQTVDVQAEVEHPYIHLLAAGSSTASDHIAFTPDRVECVKALETTLQAPNGTHLKDILCFFNGDKVAQWIEGGYQAGGNYKCGACGVPTESFIDPAHCNHVQYRSLSDAQAHVLAGIHGGKRNCAKPSEGLPLKDVRHELAARKLNPDGDSKEARLRLAKRLGGLQLVPLLLVDNPHGDLQELHLEHYSINDFEPLHAIKGHPVNLFAKVPALLPSQVKRETEQLLVTCLQKKRTTGADLRATAIVLRQFLTGKVTNEIHTQLDTIVRIAQISYLPENQRTPRTVLQLYNLTWYHHELLQHLIPAPTVLTHSKLFGSYLHDISCHAAPQFELVSLRSCNIEFEERLFGQANRVAECCSNRHTLQCAATDVY